MCPWKSRLWAWLPLYLGLRCTHNVPSLEKTLLGIKVLAVLPFHTSFRRSCSSGNLTPSGLRARRGMRSHVPTLQARHPSLGVEPSSHLPLMCRTLSAEHWLDPPVSCLEPRHGTHTTIPLCPPIDGLPQYLCCCPIRVGDAFIKSFGRVFEPEFQLGVPT